MKKIIILILLVPVLGIFGCATEAQKPQAEGNSEVPEELLRDIKINKLFMCLDIKVIHYEHLKSC